MIVDVFHEIRDAQNKNFPFFECSLRKMSSTKKYLLTSNGRSISISLTFVFSNLPRCAGGTNNAINKCKMW